MFARLRLLAPALFLFVAACGSGPDLDDLARLGRHTEIVEELEDRDRLTPQEAVQLGEAHLELNNLATASREFNLARVRAGHTSPIAFRALFGLGNVSMLRRDGATALFYFDEALAHAPTELDRVGAEEARSAAQELMAELVAPTVTESPSETGTSDPSARPDVNIPSPPEPFESALPEPPAPAGRGLLPPTVLPRKAWGARHMIRSDADAMNGVTRITVHHTGEPRPVKPTSQTQDAKRMRAYQAFHMDVREWADIGYHYVIDPSGRIWEGRSVRWQGAHAGSGPANRHNVGISVMGNFEIGPPNDKQRATLKKLVRWLVREYRIPSRGLATHQAVKKQYKLAGTACPGKHLMRYLGTLQTELRNDFAFSWVNPNQMARSPELIPTSEGEPGPGETCGCGGDHTRDGTARR